jgi:hypothetical protein
MPALEDLSMDQQHALRVAAASLKDRFSGIFSVETIEHFLATSYDQFAQDARVLAFLPLLAETRSPLGGASDRFRPPIVPAAGKCPGCVIRSGERRHRPADTTRRRRRRARFRPAAVPPS